LWPGDADFRARISYPYNRFPVQVPASHTNPEKQIEGLKPLATLVGRRFVCSDPAVRLE